MVNHTKGTATTPLLFTTIKMSVVAMSVTTHKFFPHESNCCSMNPSDMNETMYSDFADPLKENVDSLTSQQEKFNDHINLEHVFDDVVGANPYEGTKMGVELVSQLRQNQFRVMTDDQIDAFVDVLIRAFDIKNRI